MIAPFLSVLVLMITLSLGALGALGIQQIKLIPMQVCRNHQLRLQSQSLKTVQELEALNPAVRSLRAEKLAAELALAASITAGDAAGVAAATEKIELINEQQQTLLSLQQDLLQTEKATAAIALEETTGEIESQISTTLKKWNFLVQFSIPALGYGNYQLAMDPDIEEGSEPAIYTKKDNFLDAEASEVSWDIRIRPRQNGGEFSRQWPQMIELAESCKASLIERNGIWQPTLVMNQN